jgi:hypothetical protein
MVTGDMTIKEVVKKYPETRKIFKENNIPISEGCG